MVLVDTSVWSEHLRRGSASMMVRLRAGDVLMHPFVMGEIACGAFPRRAETLALMNTLPHAPVVGLDMLMTFVDRHGLAGRGVGFVDIHLLASAVLARAPVWTHDRRLADAAVGLGLSWSPGSRAH